MLGVNAREIKLKKNSQKLIIIDYATSKKFRSKNNR